MKSYPTPLALPRAPAPLRVRFGDDIFPGLKSIDRAVHETILHRAYAIWESEGHPDNCHLSHWLRAEAEVTRA